MNRYLFALSFATLVACGSSSSSTPGGGGGGAGGSSGSGGSLAEGGSAGEAAICVAGREVACSCPDGSQSVHGCKTDGTGYLACACATGGGGGGLGGGASGEAGASSASGGVAGVSAPGDAGASSGGGGEGGMPADCSPDALATTTDQGIAALHALFAGTATFCLQQVTAPISGSTVVVCTSAACANTANTCAASLASPVFSFDPVTSAFTVTGDLLITGAATAAPLGNCPDLQISAPATTVSGTLHAALDPAVNPTSVQYTAINPLVQTSSIAVAGCGTTLDGILDLALGVDVVKAALEQSVANLLSQQSFTVPCAG